jgi:hypothetical protein
LFGSAGKKSVQIASLDPETVRESLNGPPRRDSGSGKQLSNRVSVKDGQDDGVTGDGGFIVNNMTKEGVLVLDGDEDEF